MISKLFTNSCEPNSSYSPTQTRKAADNCLVLTIVARVRTNLVAQADAWLYYPRRGMHLVCGNLRRSRAVFRASFQDLTSGTAVAGSDDFNLRGIIPPLVTPLLSDDELDKAGCEQLIEHL